MILSKKLVQFLTIANRGVPSTCLDNCSADKTQPATFGVKHDYFDFI